MRKLMQKFMPEIRNEVSRFTKMVQLPDFWVTFLMKNMK